MTARVAIPPRPYLLASDYGMSPSASASTNATSLANAISAAEDQDLPLLLPSGTMDFAGPIAWDAWEGMRISGAGMAKTVLNNTAAGENGLVVSGNTTKAMGVEISDLTITGNSNASGTGLVFGSGSSKYMGPAKLERVKCHQHGGSGILIQGLIDQMMLSECVATSNTSKGFYFSNSALVSEITMVACNGAYNSVGAFFGGVTRTLTSIGCEFSQNSTFNLDVSSSDGSGPGSTTVIGLYCESAGSVPTASVQIGSTAVGSIHFISCNFVDLTSGMDQIVKVRSGVKATVFDSCSFSPVSGKVGVLESSTTTRVTYRNCLTASGTYLRKLADASTTDQRNGGPSGIRPTTYAEPGEFYFDTTLGQPIWYTGSDWVDATGASA